MRPLIAGRNKKFFAAEAADDIPATQFPGYDFGGRPQSKIADQMAKIVVDGLEVIEVQDEERDRRAIASGATQHAPRLRSEAATIEDARQRIDECRLTMLQADLGLGGLKTQEGERP